MPAERINFKELREQLSFDAVMRHYGIEGKEHSGQWHGFCPLPTHQGMGAKPKSPSFSAHFGKGIFQCFGCGAKGNVLDFIARMQGLNPDDPQGIRQAAVFAKKTFVGGEVGDETPTTTPLPAEKKEPERVELEEVPNAPLDFELKSLDFAHPYLRGRGFTDETIHYFGLGFTSRGIMKGRIAIPLHNLDGALIGYAGRIVDDAAINEENPKYRFPTERVKDGKRYTFHKLLFLYNAHRLIEGGEPLESLLIVEGYPSVWWATQAGFPNVVAVMGSSLSPEQADIVVKLTTPEARVWVMPDDDKAGERLAESVFRELGPHRWLRWLRLSDGKQPTDLPPDEFFLRFTA